MSQKKDTTSLFGSNSEFEIIKLAFNLPHKSFHIRELSRKSGYSTTAVGTAVIDLQALDIIRIEESAVTKNIKANLDSKDYSSYKIVFNLYRLLLHGFTQNLIEFFHNPECIALFGSFSRGEDIEQSDIDILIISANKKPDSGSFNKFIAEIEKEFNRKINLHVLKSLDNAEDSFKNAAANGIVLHGYLKVI